MVRLAQTLNDSSPQNSMAETGRVETLGGGRPCRITGEGLSPARSGQLPLHFPCVSLPIAYVEAMT